MQSPMPAKARFHRRWRQFIGQAFPKRAIPLSSFLIEFGGALPPKEIAQNDPPACVCQALNPPPRPTH
jgi:hypothetical protein